MRTVLSVLLISFISFAMAQSDESMRQVFPAVLNGFSPISDFESKTLNDGTLRLSRKYESGEKELIIKLSASSDENLDKNLSDIGTLINSLAEMGEAGVMTVERHQGKLYTGIFTFISRQQNVAGGLFLVRDKYLLEIEIIGGEDIQAARAVFGQLDLSQLN